MQTTKSQTSNQIYIASHAPDNSAEHQIPLVLVHGSWGSSAMWQKHIAFYTSNGWTVHALDLRGHGQSGGSVEGATMEDYATDVADAVAHLGLEQPVVIGHSMGGLVTLMYAATHPTVATIAIDPSQSAEVQGPGEEKRYPPAYSPQDAGMPATPEEAMQALPDIEPEMLMKLKEILGPESGMARSERKRGISIPRETLANTNLLFVGGEKGESVPFGIGIEKTQAMAEYYQAPVIAIKDATHPGILVGSQAEVAAQAIENWLQENVT